MNTLPPDDPIESSAKIPEKPAEAAALSPLPEPAISASALCRAGVMECVWDDPERKHQIGFIRHSPRFRHALQEGSLDPLLQELTEAYREIYGCEPWEEYLCCSSPGCTSKMSIEDIFGPQETSVSLAQLEKAHPIDPSSYTCPVDGKEMEFFYHPEHHLEALRTAFNQKVFGTLLFEDDHRLMGFCLGFETTVAEGWKDKVIPGKGDQALPQLPFSEYMEEALRLFGEGTKAEDKVINIAEWGARKETQGQGLALKLMRTLYVKALEHMRSTPTSDVPVFAHSMDGSRAFHVTSKMGFQWGQTLPSGERRAYLTLKKAIAGIDMMMSRKSVQITPLSETAPSHPEIPGDTLVIEMLCEEAVGTDEDGNAKVHQYLKQLANMMGLKPTSTSVTHLSPLYGLSGWLPLEGGAAIHLYAWDHLETHHAPFVSVDISTPGVITNPDVIITHAKQHFQGSKPITQKSMQASENPNWHELAPHIHRQRITIAGQPQQALTPERIRAYLIALAPELDMAQLSKPLLVGNAAWIHWETSGVVMHWDDKQCAVDIYTCKAFDEATALNFTVQALGLNNPHHKSF